MCRKTIGVIDVGHHDSRGVVDIAIRRFGGNALLPWVARRVTDAQRLDQVVVVMRSGDWATFAEYVPADVTIVLNDDTHLLRRMLAAADATDAQGLVRIQLEAPFVDPALIDRLVQAADAGNYDYVSYGGHVSTRAACLRAGLCAEWCRVAALRRAAAGPDRSAADPVLKEQMLDTQHLATWKYLPLPEALRQDELRLRLDRPEDWENAEEILEALGPDELDWQRIAGFVHDSPALQKRMARLNVMRSN